MSRGKIKLLLGILFTPPLYLAKLNYIHSSSSSDITPTWMEPKMLTENFIKLKRNNNKSSSSRSLSRSEEISLTRSTSIEVYYREASVGVPFLWESQPGTPKFEFHENPLIPPLQPPPSSHFSSTKQPKRRRSKTKLFGTPLPKLSLWKTSSLLSSPASSSPSSSSSSSRSSTSSVLSSLFSLRGRGSSYSRAKSSSDHMRIEDEEDECAPPVSMLCFGIGRYKC